MDTETRTLETPDVDLVYELRRPASAAEGRLPLLMVAHPMDARGFDSLASFFEDRTVITCDPRGIGRSTRKDGREERTPALHSADLRALVSALGALPVDVFASSGGAVNALALVQEHPELVRTLVAHEPPVLTVLPDADRALAAERAVTDAYHSGGFGPGMAQFIRLSSWQGEFTDAYAAQPDPDPAQFGLPTDDDGARDDPLLSGTGSAITGFRPDLRGAHRRVDPGRRRGGCRVPGDGDRAGCRGPGGGAGPAVGRVPQPPRRLPRGRVRLCRAAGGLRRPPARGPRRPRLKRCCPGCRSRAGGGAGPGSHSGSGARSLTMTTFRVLAIDARELDGIRSTGRDPSGHRAEPFVDVEGGSQLRCCLRRSTPGEHLLLVGHAPLAVDRPWREVGPVFVHATVCGGYDAPHRVPAWFDEQPRVVRAYDRTGAMRYAANRVVEAGEGVARALEEVFADSEVAEAHVRNHVAQCFIARAVRP